jgi:hypothetical protein
LAIGATSGAGLLAAGGGIMLALSYRGGDRSHQALSLTLEGHF